MAIAIQDSSANSCTGLAGFIERYQPLFALTGAGCSTASGIPDYRDEKGEWKHRKPVQYRDFLGSELTRKRYWARSMLGWPHVSEAKPSRTHVSLTRLEQAGLIHYTVTQNVDGLHQKAGSEKVLDLHGNLETVSCLECEYRFSRSSLQQQLLEANPLFNKTTSAMAPDGDAMFESIDFASFIVTPCPLCSGTIKPDVVFYGESVPRDRVVQAMQHLHEAKGMLVLGSSLMVYSGYRFCRAATESGKLICAVNRGLTRADNDLTLKIEQECGDALSDAIGQLGL